ncbi:hypothetical protein C0Q70_17901 [Pomacea canaliculata]|uniref:Uncharacterized protein n=1 Tax=Pomacea canaliculata TaxID=400727 RepID=A0A2T7NLP6_POMCA|nr:hypothetical protein C0Q70_17901 [Pomacea canaliculata]
MNRPPSYTESSYFIHQRYEDTALVIFQQQQKKKDSSNYTSQLPYAGSPPASLSPSKGKGKSPHSETVFYSSPKYSPSKTKTGIPISGHTSPLDTGSALSFSSSVSPPVPSVLHNASESVSPWVKVPGADDTVLHHRDGDYEGDRLYNSMKVGIRNLPESSEHPRHIEALQSEHSDGVSREGSGVEFGHFGSHGVIVRRQIEVSRSDRSVTKSHICVTM